MPRSSKRPMGGVNWQGVNNPGHEGAWNGAPWYTSVYFVDENHGWITSISDTYVLHTSDGGGSWEKQPIGRDKLHMTGIFFVDTQTGWAVGDNETILHTVDAGKTWVQQFEGRQDNYLLNLFFTDHNNGWAVGYYGVILHTNDGGQNWHYQNNPLQAPQGSHYDKAHDLLSLHFIDSQNGWIGGGCGRFLHTNDGGETWNLRNLGDSSCRSDGLGYTWKSVMHVLFSDAHNGVAALRDGSILHTYNSGETWDVTREGDGRYAVVDFSDVDHGWFSNGYSVIAYTHNGAQDFDATHLSREGSLFSIFFEDEQNGMAIGFNGQRQAYEKMPYYIQYTQNGGRDWEPRRNLQEVLFQYDDAHFSDTQTGWLAGVAGIVAHTVNGGVKWHRQDTGTDHYLHDIEFLNDKIGWAVGNHGTIIHTKDGGQSWILQDTPTTPWLYTAHFLDKTHGWAAGSGGAVLRTVDGGATWTAQKTGVRSQIADIFFVDQNHGWALPNTGEILRTIDGGQNWQAVTSPYNHPYESDMQIIFTDRLNGILITSTGIFQTYDGGENWEAVAETSYPLSGLRGGMMMDGETGWAVGINGTIVKIHPAGQGAFDD